MKNLISALRENNLTIASIESLTGGLFASEMVATPKASDVYLGSLVSYANVIKQDILKIDEKMIKEYGVVSKEIADLMAIRGQELFNTNISVSFTGNAGPDTLENKDLGLIYTSIKINKKLYSFKDKLSGSRNQIRKEIVEIVKDRLIKILEEKGE